MQGDQDFDQIETLVAAFREQMGVSDDIELDMIDLLRRMKIAGELADVVECDAADMGDSAAKYDPDSNTIVVRKGTLERTQFSARDRFTLAHEVAHKLLAHKFVRHRKLRSAKQFGRQTQKDEMAANATAAALLIPERLARVEPSTTSEQLAKRFNVSLQMAERRLVELQRRDRRRRGIRRTLPTMFDSGNYDEAMSQMARNARRWNAS